MVDPVEVPQAKVHSVHESVAGVILAAGQSSRMGQPKLLLPWKGEPLIRHVVRSAVDSGFSEVLVVIGSHGDQIQAVLADLDVQIVDNPDWESGQSSSVRAGIEALSKKISAAIFMLGDQPQIPKALIHSLASEHAHTKAPIIAPSVGGKRANPVLFDRAVFQELRDLRGDSGGRQLFSRYPVHLIEWDDPLLLWDIDTPEDYQKLVNISSAPE